MNSFREIQDILLQGGVPVDDVFRLSCDGQELTAREGEGNVILEVCRDEQTARREYDYDTAYRVLAALRDGTAVPDTWFPPKPTKKQLSGANAGRIAGIVFGVLLALGAGFCSLAVLAASLRYDNWSALLDMSMQIFFVGMLISGIALAWASAKKKLTVRRLFGAGGGFFMLIILLSLIFGIWSTRADDPVTPLVDYIVMTVAFGLFAAAGAALMIYTLRSEEGASASVKHYSQPRLRIEPSAQVLAPVLAAVRERTACEAIRIKLDFDRQATLFDSKLGGLPYWDSAMPYPCDEASGDRLAMLAQINLSQLPENDILPREGMLQFFILPDVEYGIGSTKKVICHKTVNRSVFEKELKALGIPGSEGEDYDDFPVTGEIAMDFEKTTTFMTPYDNRFSRLLEETAAQMGVELFDGASCGTDVDDSFYNESTGHHIGGYPYFTQFDPRSDESCGRYDFLLLQIDTDDIIDRRDKGVIWGDSGVAQFFINREALSRMELGDILYTWDCY